MHNSAVFHQDLNPASGTTPVLTGLSTIWIDQP
jgi:hypothetical protein